MKHAIAMGLWLSFLAFAVEVRAEQPQIVPPPLPVVPAPAAAPPSLPFLVSGGLLAGLGALNIAGAPFCKLPSLVLRSDADMCVRLSLGLGGALMAAGVPLLVVGVRRRTNGALPSVTPIHGGAALTWRGAF